MSQELYLYHGSNSQVCGNTGTVDPVLLLKTLRLQKVKSVTNTSSEQVVEPRCEFSSFSELAIFLLWLDL